MIKKKLDSIEVSEFVIHVLQLLSAGQVIYAGAIRRTFLLGLDVVQ